MTISTGRPLSRALPLLNALEVVGKLIGQVRVVFNGAGASGIACAEHYVRLGVKRENITMCDTKGVIYKRRSEVMNPYKDRFAKETTLRTLVGHAGCGCVRGLLGEGCGECCDDSFDGAASHCVCHGQPRPGDY